MKAVIPLAGSGTRLRPLTDHTPKCLLDIGGYTTLGLTINGILKNGINDFIFVVGFEHNKIKEFIKNNFPNLRTKFVLNPDYEVTNSIYSFWMTRELIRNEAILLLDGDIIFGEKVISDLLKSEHDNGLILRKGTDLDEEDMKAAVDDNGMVTEISKTVDLSIASGESIAIQKFSLDGVKNLIKAADYLIQEEKNVDDWYEAAIQRMIDNGGEVAAIDVNHLPCFEIDTVEDIEYAKKYIIPKLAGK